jgi:hypothetical protein
MVSYCAGKRRCGVLLLSALIMAIAACWGAGPSWAEVKIQPLLELEIGHSDNYYRTKENKAKVWIYRASPGIDLTYNSETTTLSTNYMLNFYWYENDGGGDQRSVSEDDYIGHDFLFNFAHRIGERTTLGLQDQFFLTREPAFADTFFIPVDRARYWRNRFEPFISYDLIERGTVKLAYRHENLRWIDDELGYQDSDENRGIINLIYKFSGTQQLDLEGQYYKRDYEGDSSDYTTTEVQLYYRHEFNEYLKGYVGAGYQRREFDQEGLDDIENPVFSANLNARTDVTFLDATLRHGLVDYTVFDLYYKSTRFDLQFWRLVGDSIRLGLGGYYQFSEFEQSDREDDWLNAYGFVGYKFWQDQCELRLRYSWTNRDSNLDIFDYTENQIFLTLFTAFNLGGESESKE